MRASAHCRPPLGEDPLELLVEQDQGREGRGVERLVETRVVECVLEAQELGDVAARGGDPLDPLDRGRRDEGEPQSAVRAEVLLRREVVHVGLVDREVDSAGGARRIDHGERAVVSVHAGDRCRDAGRGLVVGPRVDVDALDGFGRRAGAGRRLADVRRLQPRRLGGCRELAAELAEHEVLAAVLDEAEGCGIPEGRRSAVAGDHLVAGRCAEELAELRAHRPTRSFTGACR